jgi:alkanesulfonate monooxygenase SsuD/methylene tetrahydromethanopterin reductase-like flavin-dependent oxidoreductase (luciferase family)
LDLLSAGRLILGAGLGSDRFAAEFSATGEQVDDRVRARMLDEALAILTAAWSGEPVSHRGEHYTVDGVQFLPRPAQRPAVPIWIGASPGAVRPLRRAARYQGLFPMNLAHPDQLAEAVATVTALRPHAAAPYDIAVALPAGADPEPYVRAGATWWMPEFEPADATPTNIRAVIRNGPAPA